MPLSTSKQTNKPALTGGGNVNVMMPDNGLPTHTDGRLAQLSSGGFIQLLGEIDAEPEPDVSHSSRNPEKEREKRLEDPEESRASQENPQNQLTGSEGLTETELTTTEPAGT